MLLPSILLQEGQISLGLDNLFFWAALPTLGVAIWAKSLFPPVIIGMLIVIIGRWLQ
jgi:branched-subunit amino acid transport protein